MKIVQNKITDYLSINVIEDGTQWTETMVFLYGAFARDGHFIYRYAGANNTNTVKSPYIDYETNKNLVPTWVLYTPTNYYAMLDGETATKTTGNLSVDDGKLIFELANGRFDSFSLLGLVATNVIIELIDIPTDEVIYTESFNLLDRTDRVDAYSHYFNPITLVDSVYTDKIWLLPDSKLKVTIDNTGVIAECGRLVFGNGFFVGDTAYGGSLSQESYSIQSVDSFGKDTLIHRGSANIDTYTVRIPTSKIPALRKKGKSLDAVPILFIMDESEDSTVQNLLNFGYFRTFTMLLPNPISSTINLTIKGIL